MYTQRTDGRNMHDFYDRQYSEEELRQQSNHNGSGRSMSIALPPGVSQGEGMHMGMMSAETLNDIIMQNNEFHRRQSLPLQHFDLSGPGDGRRASMMEFGANNLELNGFQFVPHEHSTSPLEQSRRPSGEDMDMDMGVDFATANFSSVQVHDPLSIDTTAAYHGMPSDMMGDMMTYQNMDLSGISQNPTQMNMFAADNFSHPFSATSMGNLSTDFLMPISSAEVISSGSSGPPSSRAGESGETSLGLRRLSSAEPPSGGLSSSMQMSQTPLSFTPNLYRNPLNMGSYTSPVTQSMTADPGALLLARPAMKTEFTNNYSTSGFDMLTALTKVATRENPEIDIGAVDMSCAFVVCDVTLPDCPIVYVSEIFERLTGYSKHEILMQNCRFLQSPDGKVQAGVKRKFVDDETIYALKKHIKKRKEVQRSLINYRKGGQSFTNLLTMIPITWDTDEIRYYVGFQVDLVDKPNSVGGKSAGGTYSVNYSQNSLPPYIWQPLDSVRTRAETGLTISRDTVSAFLQSYPGSLDSEVTKKMWHNLLLENTDDVVHVLSLKGVFLYLSPSSRHVLEYDPSELVGMALSSVCHPSDIVPVTRELKDTTTTSGVNIVFRIRRKNSGYTWFESHGTLCVEAGKGRKCIILIGRERPVYTLSQQDIDTSGGIGENELWTKLSTSGMFLFVSSNVRVLLDRQPDELIGTSIQALMKSDSKVDFGRCLERARAGKRATYQHDIMNKRGQTLMASTTLYPGDASEGQKPTFLVGQTRLLKPSSRAPAHQAGASKSLASSRKDGSSEVSACPGISYAGSRDDSISRSSAPTSASTLEREHVITTSGAFGLPIGTQDHALASENNIFDELKTTRCTSWQFELRQMEKSNRLLAEELALLQSNKKKRKRRKGAGNLQRDCANCHTRTTPEWRRGPSGQRDLCNSCGLRWAKQVSRSGSAGSLKTNPNASSSGSSSGLT
jgi:PAS domain S-box-containing protein